MWGGGRHQSLATACVLRCSVAEKLLSSHNATKYNFGSCPMSGTMLDHHYHEKGADTVYSMSHIGNRVLYRSQCFVLVIGWSICCLAPSPGRDMWDERLFPGTKRGCYIRRRRCRCSVTRGLALRSGVLFCRLTLVAALLIWSGWTAGYPVAS